MPIITHPAATKAVDSALADGAPLVSLVISTRDRAPYLKPFLASISRIETRHRWEVIIVDNGSVDATAKILQAFAGDTRLDVRIITEPTPGLSHARNAGVRAARGRLLVFTDDDCYPQPDFIDAVVARFEAPDLGFVGGQILLFDLEDDPVCITTKTWQVDFPPGSLVTTGDVQGACMAFRREVFEDVGLFDTAFGAGGPLKGAEDCEMAARACFAGWKGGFFPQPVIYHHHRRRGRGARQITWSYDYSRGAFFAKLLVQFPRYRKLILKNWYWDTPVLFRPSRRSLSKFWRELRGALHYLLLHARSPTPRLA